MQQLKYEASGLKFSESRIAVTHVMGETCGEGGGNFSERKSLILNSFGFSPYPKGLQDKNLETRMTGLEPATSGVTGRCSNQLSYIPNVRAPDFAPTHFAAFRSRNCKRFLDTSPPATRLIVATEVGHFKGSMRN